MPRPSAKDRLVASATELFADRGYHATSTRAITRHARMSPSAIYVHFATKEEILYDLTMQGHRESLDLVTAAAATDETPTKRLATIAEVFTRWHIEHRLLARVGQYNWESLEPEHRREAARLRRRIESTVSRVLAEGVLTREFQIRRTPETARSILSLSIDVIRWFDAAKSPRHVDSLIRHHVELALKLAGAFQAAEARGRAPHP